MLSKINYIIVPKDTTNGTFEYSTDTNNKTKIILNPKTGYELEKIYYLPRFLSYLIIEVILSFVTIGGTFLISYTMFQFTKKRRCIHDYLSKSCVVDKELSFVFKNKKIEEAYKNKYGEEYEQEFKAN